MITSHKFSVTLMVESEGPLSRDQEERVLDLLTKGVRSEKNSLPVGMRLVEERHTVVGSKGRRGRTKFVSPAGKYL